MMADDRSQLQVQSAPADELNPQDSIPNPKSFTRPSDPCSGAFKLKPIEMRPKTLYK